MIGMAAFGICFLMAVVLHEVCHGLAANALGDPTAKQAGRLTLNPLKHLDPFWTLLLPALLFISTQGQFAIGMAKPVPVNFARLGRPKRDMIWVALAGPTANLFLAYFINILFRFFQPFSGPEAERISEFLLLAVYFNLGLAVFNLIPIPPLDGSKIVAGILPRGLARRYLSIEPWGFIIILILYFTRTLSHLIVPGINFFCRLLQTPKISVIF